MGRIFRVSSGVASAESRANTDRDGNAAAIGFAANVACGANFGFPNFDPAPGFDLRNHVASDVPSHQLALRRKRRLRQPTR